MLLLILGTHMASLSLASEQLTVPVRLLCYCLPFYTWGTETQRWGDLK